METRVKIRRLHFVQGESIASIVRMLNVSRNTVRSVLRSDEVNCTYKRGSQPKPKLGEYESLLDQWLDDESRLPRKQRRSAKAYHRDLALAGYQGAYDSVQRFVKSYKGKKHRRSQAFIPLSFRAGEAYQFDWSEEVVELAGVEQKIQLAQFRLSYSRKFFLAAYIRQTQEMFFDAHNEAFSYFGGVTERGIYDNLKTAVDKISIGNGTVFNRRFLCLMDHYLIEPTACTPAAGWEKGQIENQVDNVRDWVFKPRLKFESLLALNKYLKDKCDELSLRKHPQTKSVTIEAMFQEERCSLRSFNEPFAGYREVTVSVSSTCLVRYDYNQYSVDCHYANCVAVIHAYADKIEVYVNDQRIASHQRLFGKDKMSLDPWHYLALLERKPGAIRNGAPFQDWQLPAPILKVRDKFLRRSGGDKDYVAILMALSQYGIDEVSVACELAITDRVISKDYILNVLSRLCSDNEPKPIQTPEHLILKEMPTSDCQRYDMLLGGVQ